MPQNIDNKELLINLIKGDEKAFEQAYYQYHQAVLANICKLISNQHEAEDILQEVYITLWNNKHKLSTEHSVAGWLFTASYYKSLAYIKKNIKQSLTNLSSELQDILVDNTNENVNEADYTQKLSTLNAAIELLPPQKKLAFKLSRLEGKTYDEIALILNISTESAKDYVKSASKLLKRHFLSKQLTSSAISSYLLFLYLNY